MKERYIYEIRDWRGNFYIGKKTGSPEKTKYYLGSGKHIQSAIKLYGKEKFEKTILYVGLVTVEQINNLEKFYIEFYRKNYNAYYNISKGGDGGWDYLTPEQEEKRKLNWASPEARYKMGNSRRGKPQSLQLKEVLKTRNKNHSEETKQKMSKSALKRWTLEEKEKLSSMLIETGLRKGKNNPRFGVIVSEKTKQKIRENIGPRDKENNSFFGRNHTKESKEKMSKSLKNQKFFTNGISTTRGFICPEGFWEGRHWVARKKKIK